MTKEDYNNKIIDDAVMVLKNDGIIILPTDTIYGMAIDSGSVNAFNKIYEVKKRNLSKKLPLVVDTYDRLISLCEIKREQLKKLQKYYPGKLTLVLKRKDRDETVAVRMINNEIINKIIEKLDRPLMLTSANVSGKKTSSDILKIIDEFDGLIDMVIMGDKLDGKESTIVELKEGELVLIREGAILFSEIEESYYRG